jgi:excisionase family DNA binding protein
MGHLFQKFVPPLSPRSARTRGQNRLNGGGVGPGEDGFLSVAEVARALGVSTASVYKLCRRGQLAHVRILNTVRVPARDLASLLGRSATTGRRERR